MAKYHVYVNASIEISDDVDAEDECEAYQKAYYLIGHRDYECSIDVTKIEE